MKTNFSEVLMNILLFGLILFGYQCKWFGTDPYFYILWMLGIIMLHTGRIRYT